MNRGSAAASGLAVPLPLLEDRDGNLVAPDAPCRFQPQLARRPVFQRTDKPGVPVRISADTV
jgi:hypothetical protein